MKKVFSAGGILDKGFVGQISYTVCLDEEYKEMDIEFSFDKQHYTDITDGLKAETAAACSGEYGMEPASDEELTGIIKEMKTEIHTIATMNGTFIGGVHKQLTTRHMLYAGESASEGCIPQVSILGVIRITLVVFNVILDGTRYNVSLSVGR